MLGIFFSALFTAAISVYLFHDVDKDQIGHWNEAFVGQCAEIVLFTLVIGGGVGLLTMLGRYLFHLREYSPRTMLGLFLGIGVTVFQYPWEFTARREFPGLADISRALYLVAAIAICAIIIVRDNFRQTKASQHPTT